MCPVFRVTPHITSRDLILKLKSNHHHQLSLHTITQTLIQFLLLQMNSCGASLREVTVQGTGGASGRKPTESCWSTLSQTSDVPAWSSLDAGELSLQELGPRPLCPSDLHCGGESTEVSGVDYFSNSDTGFGPEAFKHSFDFMSKQEYWNGLKGGNQFSIKADLVFFGAISRLLKLSSFLRQWKSVTSRTEESYQLFPNETPDSVQARSDDAIHKPKSRGKSADALRSRLSEV